MQQCVESTKEACSIPSLSQDARTHYCAHAYAHTYAYAQSQACAFHEHANDSCQQNARSIENICGAASTPIRMQEACGIPLRSGCMHALLYARTCTHICTCARPSLLRSRALFVINYLYRQTVCITNFKELELNRSNGARQG